MSTLLNIVYAQKNADLSRQVSALDVAKNYFGEQSQTVKMLASKSLQSPTQADKMALVASQAFYNLVKEQSILGAITALNTHHLAVPLDTAITTLDFSAAQAVTEGNPTKLLNDASNLGFKPHDVKIGGYGIFSERYFNPSVYPDVEQLIDNALAQSYAQGENAYFVDYLSSTAATAGSIGEALATFDDAKNVVILMPPLAAFNLGKAENLADLGINGGSYHGVTVITDKAVKQPILFDVSHLAVAPTTIEMSMSNEADVQDSEGKNVPLFQNNLVAVKVIGVTAFDLVASQAIKVTA